MKLSEIKKEDILQAGKYIDEHGVPSDNLWNNYWVIFQNNKEYPFKYLTSLAYEKATGKKAIFESNESYRTFVEQLGFNIKYYAEGYSFINIEEIEHFEKNAGKKYRMEIEENARDGKLLNSLIKKLNYWASQTALGDLIYREDNTWQWSGTFKSYIWIRISRKNDSGKVFFIVGANGDGSLFYKIDCQRSNHTMGSTKALSKDKIRLIDDYLKRAGLKKGSDNKYDGEVLIDKSDLVGYDWSRLIGSSRNFITENLSVYNDLEKIVNEEAVGENTTNILRPGEKPETIISKIPTIRQYSGYKTNFSKKYESSKILGDLGEELVLNMEIEKLKKLGLTEKAKMVRKELDGKGYDITSYDENGDEIHIEVKTTVLKNDEPFYMSLNEKDFFLEYPDNYLLYRLYEYHFQSNSAKFFILNPSELKGYSFNPMGFEVSQGSHF